MRDIRKLNNKARPQNDKKIQEKKLFLKTCISFLKQEKYFLTALIAEYFFIKSKGSSTLKTDNSKVKILTPKQILEIFPIAPAQVKAGNNSENVLNEIRHFVYSLYQSKNNH